MLKALCTWSSQEKGSKEAQSHRAKISWKWRQKHSSNDNRWNVSASFLLENVSSKEKVFVFVLFFLHAWHQTLISVRMPLGFKPATQLFFWFCVFRSALICWCKLNSHYHCPYQRVTSAWFVPGMFSHTDIIILLLELGIKLISLSKSMTPLGSVPKIMYSMM